MHLPRAKVDLSKLPQAASNLHPNADEMSNTRDTLWPKYWSRQDIMHTYLCTMPFKAFGILYSPQIQ